MDPIPNEPLASHQQGYFVDIMKHISVVRTDQQRPSEPPHSGAHAHKRFSAETQRSEWVNVVPEHVGVAAFDLLCTKE